MQLQVTESVAPSCFWLQHAGPTTAHNTSCAATTLAISTGGAGCTRSVIGMQYITTSAIRVAQHVHALPPQSHGTVFFAAPTTLKGAYLDITE